MMQKHIDKRSAIPKYYQLSNILKEAIRSGVFGKGRLLPSERQLFSQYNVSRNTIRQALASLEEEGLILREQGKGTTVLPLGMKLTNQQVVAAIINCHGHVYEAFSTQIIHVLQEKGYYPIIVELDQAIKDVKVIDRLIKFNPAGVIIEGLSAFPFSYFKDKELEHVIFTHYFESPEKFPGANFVLSDYEYGGYIGAKHLLGLGHRKISVLIFKQAERPYYCGSNFLKGCRRALEEANLNPKDNFSIIFDKENDRDNRINLSRILSQPHRPTAIFAFGDFRAKTIYEAASRLKLSIPDDLAVIGYFNTPWCEIYQPNLTSISIKENEIVKVTVKTMFESRGEKIMIKPELIIRESCGYRLSRRRTE